MGQPPLPLLLNAPRNVPFVVLADSAPTPKTASAKAGKGRAGGEEQKAEQALPSGLKPGDLAGLADFAARPPKAAGTVVTDEGDGVVKVATFLSEQKFI